MYSLSLSRGLLAILFLRPAALAQTSTAVVVMSTPLPWQDASLRCRQIGSGLYRVPSSATDPVYAVLERQPEERYWISRRTGGSCTTLNKNAPGDMLEEAPCGDALPAFCAT